MWQMRLSRPLLDRRPDFLPYLRMGGSTRMNRAQFEATLNERIDEVIRAGKTDPGVAHSEEDTLLDTAMRLYAPPSVIAKFNRLADADFPRWCA